MNDRADIDPEETRDWLDSLEAVIELHGPARAHYLLDQLIDRARRRGAHLPYRATTAYVNTILPGREPRYPGDRSLEKRIEAYIRWNAMAMVVHANAKGTHLGGHIATYQSAAVLYEVGFNHFWRAPSEAHPGDLVFIQGHSSPGIYARSFLEGRLTRKQLLAFREEVDLEGLSSYPHPWLMPEYWQFPTVSMGLGPLMAIYLARFLRYLENRGLAEPTDRKVWAFLGDGEMDEPESMAAISLAAREGLDNLVFVINCNLQRLDGPVRGTGKIIQELEADFRGNGWNVIKVVWGSRWDPLLARDREGLLVRLMNECVDGEYQAYKANDGAFVREHFFGRHPELMELVANMSDEEVWRLNRGGHDHRKVYAAYHRAVTRSVGRPTVILAKTIKGYGLGASSQGVMGAHQMKKLDEDGLKAFRSRYNIPIPDEDISQVPLYEPPADSPEMLYLRERREALGGYLPQRLDTAPPLEVPPLEAFAALLEDSGEREFSTTMAFVRLLRVLARDRNIGERIVPIIPDEARTFGMEGMFRQLGIYSSCGQNYEPQDRDQLAFYREATDGQILEEGINEAGAMCSWIAAGTSYASSGLAMIPFYAFYSMFGFQRVGDLCWAAGDIRARGFLIGCTSGRTTLNGEGLQHGDGQSHVLAAAHPSCRPYDPTFAYELAVIIHDGLRRMYVDRQDVYYYVTCMNENYAHPALPEGAEEGILRGLYALEKSAGVSGPRVQLLGSGAILREAIAAAEMLQSYGVAADVWSAPSFTLLAREGRSCDRWNRLHPGEDPKVPWITACFEGIEGPFVAATDYVAAFAEQIRPWVPGRYTVLGTDGYGRSDAREKLRSFFEVGRDAFVVAALSALEAEGRLDASVVRDAIARSGCDPDRADPSTL
ncbi:MAG TPA: pyruvate dehydrogenase (acetyl-transferring), homodimeric type [Myxococcota bacterium]|nr:pyruvate dehydrogenase (acetyl-transferring), homodimeric type [Myxococcota bacterium]